MDFRKTFPFDRGYVYLGRYVFEKLHGRGRGYFYLGRFVYLAVDSIFQNDP